MNIAGEDAEGEVVYFGFAEQVEAARDGWLQGRYYSEEGDTVADVLSFRAQAISLSSMPCGTML